MTADDLGALRRETAAAALLGGGIGLALGTGVALLTRRLVARPRSGRARVAVGPAGLVGRF
jgi:hypothetical protein